MDWGLGCGACDLGSVIAVITSFSPTPCLPDADLVADVSVPDGTQFSPGEGPLSPPPPPGATASPAPSTEAGNVHIVNETGNRIVVLHLPLA